ncbi:MAG: ABC transporter substrate-binding protein [Anaerolineae bacterium]
MKGKLLVLVIALAAVALFAVACAQAPAAPAPAAPAQQPAQQPAAAQPTAAPAAKQAEAPKATEAPKAAPAATAAPAAAAKTTSGGKEFHGAWPYVLPPKGHYNQFVTDFIMGGGIYDYVVLPPLALYDWANSKFIPYLATEWKNEPGDWFTVKLRDGVKWTDGSDLTSADVVTTFNLARLMGQSVWKYIDKVEAPDKSTVRFHFTSPTSVAPRFILRQTLINPNSVYKEWGDKAAALFAAGKTQDSDEVKALRKDFTEFRPKDLVSSGPYKLDPASVTSSRMDLVKHPQGLFADKVGFDKLVLFNGETPDITPVMMSKDADYATHGFPPATEKAYLDNGIRIIRPPTNSGPALFFNYTDKNLANPAVRQAMAYSIKRDENGAVSLGKSGIASKYLTGFSDNAVPTWLSADDAAKLNQYPYDLKKAEEVMTKAGYKKGSDGFWQDPSGKTLEWELTAPAEFADWSAAAENLAKQLTDGGFKTTFRGVQFQQHNQDVQQGKFQLAIRGWGAGNPHPFFAYESDLLTYNPPLSPGQGMSFPFKQQVDGKDVDLSELIKATAVGATDAEQKPAVTKMAQTFNQLLPIIPLWERYGNNAAVEGVRVANFPPDSDPIWKNALYGDNPVVILLMDGRLQPKS